MNTVYSITDWPSDMSDSDIYVLFLPGAYATGADYDLDATLKYPDSTFPTVDHLFYVITAI